MVDRKVCFGCKEKIVKHAKTEKTSYCHIMNSWAVSKANITSRQWLQVSAITVTQNEIFFIKDFYH